MQPGREISGRLPLVLLSAIPTDPLVAERVERLEIPFNRFGIDPYGIDKRALAQWFSFLGFFYHQYFDVEVFGVENVPAAGRAMMVGNHSGGVALDGAMILASTFFEMNPPRLTQAMADRFLAAIPGAGHTAKRVGQVTGLPEHALRFLADERLLLVFPEGHRGTAKLAHESDTLVRFGTGFMRLALAARAPIVPVAFIGGGEAFPTIANSEALGKLIRVPYVPIPRFLNPVPRRVRLQILFGPPMHFEGTGNEDDATIAGLVDRVRVRVGWLIEQGRAYREGYLPAAELELGTTTTERGQ